MGGPQTDGDFDALIDQQIHASMQGAKGLSAVQVKANLLELRKELLPHQLRMVEDPSKRKAAICTRQSGKTYHNRQVAAEAVVNNPWTNKRKNQPIVQYIAQTQKKALDMFWTPFKLLCERVGLDAHWDDQNLRAQFSNGVLVRAGGADKKEEIEKYRGDSYVLVLIDEAASFGPKVENLIVAGLSMAMIAYDGTILMTGTPGQAQAGYFYEVYAGSHPEWSVQPCWSFMDNIHLPANARTEQWIIESVGPLDSPRVRRECFGEWVTDASSLVYQYDSLRNEWERDLPAGHDWQFILGIDVGYRDPTAFVIGAYARTHPWLFIVHAEAHEHWLPSQIEAKIGQLKEQYKIGRIVMDTGGSMALNNMVEWNMRSNFGIIPANKREKYEYIEHMNSEFYLSRIKVFKDLPVIQEWKTLPWADADAEKDSVRHDGRPKEHSGFSNHMTDAALYMFKESTHYRSKEPEPPPEPGTPDYWSKMQLRAKIQAFNSGKTQGFRYNRMRN